MNRRVALLLLSIFLAALLSGCFGFNRTNIPPTGTVTGTATDGTGIPIAGATVSVAGRTGTTNEMGFFRIERVPAGTHTLTVTAPGKDVYLTQVTVVAGQVTVIQDLVKLLTESQPPPLGKLLFTLVTYNEGGWWTNGQAYLQAASAGERAPLPVTDAEGGVAHVALSPDGSEVAYLWQGMIVRHVLVPGSPPHLTVAEQGSSPHVLAYTRSYGAGPLDWSPALPGHPGGWIVWVRFNAQSQQHELHFWDAAWPNDSGNQPVVVPLPPELVGAAEQVVMLRWSPDGSRLAISKAATPPYFALRVVEVRYDPQGNPPWSIGPFNAVVWDSLCYSTPAPSFAGLSWSQDALRLAYASFWPNRVQCCFSVTADGSQLGSPQQLTSGTGYADYSPAFAPQEGLLAFVTNREGARTWSVYFFDPADPAHLYRTWTSPDESWDPTVTGLRWYP